MLAQGDFDALARGLNGAKAPAEQQNGRSSAREELYGVFRHARASACTHCHDLQCMPCHDVCIYAMTRSTCTVQLLFDLRNLPSLTLRCISTSSLLLRLRMSGKITSVGAAAVGGRVKYLVDTPEMIWGCLDLKDYQAAAQRFLGCDACFHTGLTRPVVFSSRQRSKPDL